MLEVALRTCSLIIFQYLPREFGCPYKLLLYRKSESGRRCSCAGSRRSQIAAPPNPCNRTGFAYPAPGATVVVHVLPVPVAMTIRALHFPPERPEGLFKDSDVFLRPTFGTVSQRLLPHSGWLRAGRHDQRSHYRFLRN